MGVVVSIKTVIMVMVAMTPNVVMMTVVMTVVMAVVMAVMMISAGTVVMADSSGGGDEHSTCKCSDGGEWGGSDGYFGGGNERGEGVLSLISSF